MSYLHLTRVVSTLVIVNLIITTCYLSPDTALVEAQRSLHHWKRDLEYRLTLYRNQRDVIDNIISSSIYPSRGSQLVGPTRVSANGNVRFSDLIIPNGALILESHIARPTVKILADKTQGYVGSKMNELYQIKSQLDTLRRQLVEQHHQFIYKGSQFVPQPQRNYTKIPGTRVFKQVPYAHLIETRNVTLQRVNFTSVDKVISDTYMLNQEFGLYDSEKRLYFEGRKTFWNAVFSRPLKSGCCDRLRPLHTSRMMLRSINQDILAPVLIHSRDLYAGHSAVIHELVANQMYNRLLAFAQPNQPPPPLGLDPMGLVPSGAENFIRPPALIYIRQPNQPEVLKTLVFKDTVSIEEAFLANSYLDGRLVIGLGPSQQQAAFDLSHENYLLKFMNTNKNYSYVQQVKHPLIINGMVQLMSQLDADLVNRVPNFNQFVRESLVRVDRPTTIRGPVQFNALPTILNPQAAGPSARPQSVVVLQVTPGLEVGLLNGMRIPHDIVLLPSQRYPNQVGALRPRQMIRVQGPRQFASQVTFHDFSRVLGPINGLQMPAEVIPLHLNDFMGVNNIGYSNLWFADGISAHHMTIQSGQFDDIVLRDVFGDAQSIIMRSVLSSQPDGSQLIRAPLRVMNLNLISRGPSSGLLNGFRPHEVLELAKYPFESIQGRKTFLAPVEADDCHISDINQVANWTQHLIRADRPQTLQTIHSRLAFTQPPTINDNQTAPPTGQPLSASSSSVRVNQFRVEFYPENDPVNYVNNWHFAPEFYIMHQALLRANANINQTGYGRYRVLNQVRLMTPQGRVNGIPLNDIVTLSEPFRFADRFVLVGKVEVATNLEANRIHSNYPIDAMDLVQFNKYRIPLTGSRSPIQLTNLVLGPDNRASFVQSRFVNGLPFSEFVGTIMSLTRPQKVYSNLTFNGPVDIEAPIRTGSSLNNVKNFREFASKLKSAKYLFENGLQCNSVVIG